MMYEVISMNILSVLIASLIVVELYSVFVRWVLREQIYGVVDQLATWTESISTQVDTQTKAITAHHEIIKELAGDEQKFDGQRYDSAGGYEDPHK